MQQIIEDECSHIESVRVMRWSRRGEEHEYTRADENQQKQSYTNDETHSFALTLRWRSQGHLHGWWGWSGVDVNGGKITDHLSLDQLLVLYLIFPCLFSIAHEPSPFLLFRRSVALRTAG